MIMGSSSLPFSPGIKVATPVHRGVVQLFDFQWLARPVAGSVLLHPMHGSRR